MKRPVKLLTHQIGAFNLYWVAILSCAFAAVAMAALMSMRSERNLFAEGWNKLATAVGASPAGAAIDAARQASQGSENRMRKCVIHGKAVISNSECLDSNPTSKDIKIQVTRGVEAPKKPPEPVKSESATPLTDKMIEKVVQ